MVGGGTGHLEGGGSRGLCVLGRKECKKGGCVLGRKGCKKGLFVRWKEC